MHGWAGFVVNENMYAVLFRKSFRDVILVFPNAFFEIARHAHIERSVLLAGKDIHARYLF